MSILFQPLPFHGKPYLWSYRNWSTKEFGGYYHWHQGFEVLIVHQGRGSVIVNRQTYEIRPGMLFFFQPYLLHKVFAAVDEEHPYERTVFHFEPAFMEAYLSSFPSLRDVFTRIRQGLVQAQAYDMIDKMDIINVSCHTFDSYQNSSSPAVKGEQSGLLLLQLLSCIRSDVLQDETEPKPLRYSEQMMQWIEAHYAEPFELDRLAAELHMSKSYLSRLFRRETGSSITTYLTARRIQQACSLLQASDQPIDRIGEQVGLPNVSYFIQLFKKVVGTSPHQYRLKL